MRKKIIVEGMDTFLMGSAITHILEGMAGIERIKLNLEEEAILIEYSTGSFTEEELCDAINAEGFEVLDLYDEPE